MHCAIREQCNQPTSTFVTWDRVSAGLSCALDSPPVAAVAVVAVAVALPKKGAAVSSRRGSGEQPSRHVIVVGATGAVGGQVGLTLHKLGYDLTLTHRSGEPTFSPVPATWRKLDVCDSEEVSDVFSEAQREHGTPYALVYAAGIKRDKPMLTMSPNDWKDVIDTNLSGAYACLRAVTRNMLVAGQGRIVLIGSVSGRRAVPGQAAYSSAKAGLEALCRVAAIELGRATRHPAAGDPRRGGGDDRTLR